MGNFVGITSTGFVGSGEMAAVTSFMPCHIFGDQMLIGAGIRIGFYLLYLAAIVAILFSVDKQFRLWHGAWGVVALSLFLAMFLNIVDFNLIIIDYAVLIHLVLWYPVFFVFTVLFRQALVVSTKVAIRADAEYRERLQRCRRSRVTELDVRRARAYADVLRAFALFAAAEEADRDRHAAQTTLSEAVRHFVSHWHEQIEADDESSRRSQDMQADGGAVTTVYNSQLVDEIAAAPTRADIDKLRDLYVAALVHSHHTVTEARAAEQEIARIAAEELRIKRHARRPKQAIRHFLFATSYKDQIAAALGLLIWSVFMFGTAALHWPLLHNGNKPDGVCNNVPTVYFVFAPKKPFADPGFSTFLRVWTVGVCIVAVVTTAVALFILTASLFGPAIVGFGPRTKTKVRSKTAVEEGRAHEHDRHDDDDNDDYDDHVAPVNLRDAKGYSHKARARHTQAILACIANTESRSIPHRYRRATTAVHEVSSSATEGAARFTVEAIPWALLLLVLLAVSVICAELTINRQGVRNNTPLDFARPPLRETAEILIFLIGLYALVLVLLSVLAGLLSGVFSSLRGDGKKGKKGKGKGRETVTTEKGVPGQAPTTQPTQPAQQTEHVQQPVQSQPGQQRQYTPRYTEHFEHAQ
ncbi:hypothetical protein VTJ83DRAFT_5190 [Remersonia thermophila]|uniref:Uncharacterized protein n=1 Tax=Remersonia thermophila TaxID=72144 RepID=A0ABR4DC61_9PEZI